VGVKGTCAIGIIGMAVMGQNLALNIARKGFPVAVFNRTAAKTQGVLRDQGERGIHLSSV